MQTSKRMRTARPLVGMLAVCICGFLYVHCSGTFLTELDRSTGRLRTTHSLGGLRLSVRERDTGLSRLTASVGIAPKGERMWTPVFVTRASLLRGRFHDHYRAAELCRAVQQADMLLELVEASVEAKAEAARLLLEWLRDGDVASLEAWNSQMNAAIEDHLRRLDGARGDRDATRGDRGEQQPAAPDIVE